MISLTPSHLIQHLYCPRFTYFEWVLRIPQYEEKFSKVMRGRNLHDERLERNKGYLRRRLGVVDRHDDQYLTNDYLRGRVDEVLELEDGTLAPLDYKFAPYQRQGLLDLPHAAILLRLANRGKLQPARYAWPFGIYPQC